MAELCTEKDFDVFFSAFQLSCIRGSSACGRKHRVTRASVRMFSLNEGWGMGEERGGGGGGGEASERREGM